MAAASAARRALCSSSIDPRTVLGGSLPRRILGGSRSSPSCVSIYELDNPSRRESSIISCDNPSPSSSAAGNFSIVWHHSSCLSEEKNRKAGAAVVQCCSVDERQFHSSSASGNLSSQGFVNPSSLSSSPRRSAVLLRSSFVPRFRDGGARNSCPGKPSLGLYRRRPGRVCSLRVRSQRCRGSLFIENSRFFSGGLSAGRLGGYNDAAEKNCKLRSVTARASAAAAAPPATPSQAFNNWWSRVWGNFFALCASFGSRLESLRIGWLDVLTMLRIVVLAAGALGAYVASKRAWAKIREHASGKSDGEEGGGGDGGPMQMLARGATTLQSNMGPWSMTDLAMGLTAISKVTEKKPPSLPGQEVKDLQQDSTFLMRAQHWRSISEACYAPDSGSFSMFSNLPESALVAAEWEPCQESFRPAYSVFVDAPYGAVVLAVRGTSHIIDMLLNSGTSAEPFGDDGSVAHGGFVHATNLLYEEVLPHIEKAFKDHCSSQKDMKLVIVGHSMGAAVGSLTGLKLREKFPDLQCWGFCPPACMSLDLAKSCKSFTTSFVAAYDLVPRFSLHSVEKLREAVQDFDWDELEKVAKDDEDWQNTKKTIETFRQFRQAKSDAMDKVPGVEDSDTAQKAIEKGNDAMNTDTGKQVIAKAKDIGNKGKDVVIKTMNVLEGNNENQGEESKEEDDEDKEPPPPLYPPGRLLLLGSDPPGCGKKPEQRSDVSSERNYGSYPTFDEAKSITWRMFEAEQEELEEIVVSPWLLSDHMLGNMCEAIGYFQSQCPPAVK